MKLFNFSLILTLSTHNYVISSLLSELLNLDEFFFYQIVQTEHTYIHVFISLLSRVIFLYYSLEVHLIPNLVDIQDQLITSDKGTEQPEERNVVNLETQEPNLQSEPGNYNLLSRQFNQLWFIHS